MIIRSGTKGLHDDLVWLPIPQQCRLWVAAAQIRTEAELCSMRAGG